MDPRKILGVDDKASEEEIQQAYRRKARKHHPDLGGDAWAFQQVKEAYDLLTNPSPKKARKPSQPKPAAEGTARDSSQHTTNQFRETARSQSRSQSDSATQRPADVQTRPTRGQGSKVAGEFHAWSLLTKELPLQTETTTFIFVNCLDIFLTYILLRQGAMEANPIANFFMRQWGFDGMIAFKLCIVAFVCVVAQVVACRNLGKARGLLVVGAIAVGLVVLYSIILFMKHFR